MKRMMLVIGAALMGCGGESTESTGDTMVATLPTNTGTGAVTGTTTGGTTGATTGSTTGTTSTTTTGGKTTGTPSLMADIQPIFNQECGATCHLNNGASGGLDLDTNTYANLVDAPSVQAPLSRVVPGDLDGSYLWHKLNNTHIGAGGSGGSMPPAGTLSAGDLQTIRQWIVTGASP